LNIGRVKVHEITFRYMIRDDVVKVAIEKLGRLELLGALREIIEVGVFAATIVCIRYIESTTLVYSEQPIKTIAVEVKH